MNQGPSDPFQSGGGGWPGGGGQPEPPQSPWVPANPQQGSAPPAWGAGSPSAPPPYPPPPPVGTQWQAGPAGPWNAPPMMNGPYTPPPSNKTPWIIGGVIGTVLLLLVVIVVVATNLTGGDDTTDRAGATSTTSARASGSKTTSQSPATTSTSAAAPGADGKVEASELQGVLLSASTIGEKLKAPGLTAGPVETSLSTDPATPPDCAGVWAPGAQSAYADSGYTDVAIQTLSAGPAPHVVQAVVLFPDEAAAQASFQKQASTWAACRFKSMNATYDGLGTDTVKTTGNGEDKAEEFLNMTIFTDLTGAADAITCSRGLARRANVIVDVRGCTRDNPTAGYSVARDIGKNITGKR
ncbi:sensor domain-containing protein [Mycobacterium sp. NPDC004974]